MSWLQQNDLLAHNRTELFITHGGLNGAQIMYMLKNCPEVVSVLIICSSGQRSQE